MAALGVLLAAGCAVDPYRRAPIVRHLEARDAVGDCARLLQAVDRQIDAAGLRDAQSPRVPGFPYLRSDRFTASLVEPAATRGADGLAAWRDLMAAIDRQARAAELANAGSAVAPAALDACRDVLAAADGDQFGALRAAARVPDDYSLALRALGLYPLTRLAFAAGIARWQQATREVFATDAARLPVDGRILRYAPQGAEVAPPALPAAAALDLPSPPPARLAEWALRHAPVLEVDTATDDDRIGALRWSASGDGPRIEVDVGAPVAYLRTAFTHFTGRIRLQLVYGFWFPARPAAHALDLLAGRLDGLLWRVTLDERGAALVYDAIHPCGCYPLFFPTESVAARPQPRTLDEGLFAPQVAPTTGPGERIVLRVASRSHYLQRVSATAAVAPDLRYGLIDEAALRTLPWPGGGTRSAYDAAGFIAGTERAERWLFWPMGIASAGQMRQWGRHATAFVGRRHFDDPHLLDAYFAPREPEATTDRR